MDVDEQNEHICSSRQQSKVEEESRSEEGSQAEEDMSNQSEKSEEISIMPPTIKWHLYPEDEEEKSPYPQEALRHKQVIP